MTINDNDNSISRGGPQPVMCDSSKSPHQHCKCKRRNSILILLNFVLPFVLPLAALASPGSAAAELLDLFDLLSFAQGQRPSTAAPRSFRLRSVSNGDAATQVFRCETTPWCPSLRDRGPTGRRRPDASASDLRLKDIWHKNIRP